MPVKAETRTIVVPDDYLTVTAAIGNATDGDAIFVRKGTYEEPRNQTLIINKTISLIGEDTKDTIVNLHPPLIPYTYFTVTLMLYAPPIQIEADNVKISGFNIISDVDTETQLSANGNQIKIINNILNYRVAVTGNKTQIINNTLTGITLVGSHVFVADNNVSAKYTAQFLISCTGSGNIIFSNYATDVVPLKETVDYSGGIKVEGFRNIIQDNYVNTQSGIGPSLNLDGDENIAYQNTLYNLVSIGSKGNLVCGNIINSNLETSGNNNTFIGNYLWGVSFGSTTDDVSNDTFYYNNFDFAANTFLSKGDRTFTIWSGVHGPIFMDNGTVGNYYSDYNGSDLNYDGIGDTPYIIYANDTRNYHYVADFNIANITLTDHYPLMQPFNFSNMELKMPEWATTAFSEANRPVVSIDFPESLTYNGSNVNLTFTVDKSTSWLGYSLDGNDNVTIAGNTTLTNLSSGLHNVTVYAMDKNGNIGASETVTFSIAEPEKETFPTVSVAVVSGASLAIAGVGLLVYFKKHKRQNSSSSAVTINKLTIREISILPVLRLVNLNL